MNEQQTEPIDGWGVVELMGHVVMAGRVSEENHFGSIIGRVDIPDQNGNFKTQYFGASGLYRLTPCDEQQARIVAYAHPFRPSRMLGVSDARSLNQLDNRGDDW